MMPIPSHGKIPNLPLAEEMLSLDYLRSLQSTFFETVSAFRSKSLAECSRKYAERDKPFERVANEC